MEIQGLLGFCFQQGERNWVRFRVLHWTRVVSWFAVAVGEAFRLPELNHILRILTLPYIHTIVYSKYITAGPFGGNQSPPEIYTGPF